MRHLAWTLVAAAACSGPPPAAQPQPQPAPDAAPPAPAKTAAPAPMLVSAEKIQTVQANAETVTGTIDKIELHNINKAQGKFTYNVELVLARAGAEPLRVRVAKIFFDRLPQAKRSALAPEGAKQTLTPSTYEAWSVGDAVELKVEVTSPGLAHLVEG
jgi:hypothetical protein